MSYPPLGYDVPEQFDSAPPPGQRSDHGTPGHGLFLGPTADAFDMGTTYNPVYAVERLEAYSNWHHYSSADGQDYGWVALFTRPNGLSVAYAHLQDRLEKEVYEEGEQIGIISDILNYDHLHFEADQIVAGDFSTVFGGDDMTPEQQALLEKAYKNSEALMEWSEAINQKLGDMIEWRQSVDKYSLADIKEQLEALKASSPSVSIDAIIAEIVKRLGR